MIDPYRTWDTRVGGHRDGNDWIRGGLIAQCRIKDLNEAGRDASSDHRKTCVGSAALEHRNFTGWDGRLSDLGLGSDSKCYCEESEYLFHGDFDRKMEVLLCPLLRIALDC